MLELAVAAEEHGWDGFFLWDHMDWGPPVRALADPWVALGAVAAHTERLRIGPLVTPLSRRRVHKLARETVTLDQLSQGRLVLGVGLGGNAGGELERFGEIVEQRERARLLDAGLEQLIAFWAGELEPRPVQEPRIPIWVGGLWPNRPPLRRAARFEGFFPVDVPDPAALAEVGSELAELRRGQQGPFELVVHLEPHVDLGPWREAGATWAMTDFGEQPDAAAVRDVIEHALR